MHFVGIGAGSAGDVLPFLLVARALKDRGHEVQIITAPQFQAMVESAGIGFVAGSSQAQFEAAIRDPDIWHPLKATATLWRHIGPHWAQAYEVLAAAVRPGESLVYGGALALQMRLAQEKLGVKAVTIHLAPAGLLSAHDPPPVPYLGRLSALPPRLVRALLSLLERQVLDPMILPDLNRFRSSIGLQPVRERVLSQWMNSPDKVVCAFPAWFAAPQPDWPQNTVCTTFAVQGSSAAAALSAGLAEFMEAGPAPLLFTPGSGMAHGREFFVRAIETTRALGMRAILVTRYADQVPDTLPASVIHVPFVPFDLLVPRVAMLIHHGGIGTIAQGLAAAKPQLLTPFAYDQPDNARRLKRLGVAAVIDASSPARRWTKAVASLLGDRRVAERCSRLAARLQQEGSGAERIADQIMAAARNGS